MTLQETDIPDSGFWEGAARVSREPHLVDGEGHTGLGLIWGGDPETLAALFYYYYFFGTRNRP